jgi:hypothetical protein
MDAKEEESPGSDLPKESGEVVAQTVPALSKTPFFEAINALRYQRQAMIKAIEDQTKCPLICYVAGINAAVHRDDIIGFVDLLHNLESEHALDFLLHTPGGDTDAAEKIIYMVRKKVGKAKLRIIVPDYAKSAGTFMVLAADSVVMSDSSELGPIDPQVIRSDGTNRFADSVLSYLDAYETHKETLSKDPSNVTAQIMMNKLDPSRLKSFEAMKERARKGAEAVLQDGMFKDGRPYTQTVTELLGLEKTKTLVTHGQPLNAKDAANPKIGLVVDYRPPDEPEWQLYWQLYVHQRLALTNDKQKLYESNRVSIVVDP